jgi:hypothetical protein
LLYNLNQEGFPTNVDLVGFMLLVQEKVEVSQYLLKGLLVTAAIVYLYGMVLIYKQTKIPQPRLYVRT